MLMLSNRDRSKGSRAQRLTNSKLADSLMATQKS
jgi:hypothetical protein